MKKQTFLIDEWDDLLEYNAHKNSGNDDVDYISYSDDGFLPLGVTSAYEYFLGYQGEKIAPKHANSYPLTEEAFLNTSSNRFGFLYEDNRRIARVTLAGATHSRYLKTVEFKDENGKYFLIDGYNKYGYKWHTAFYDKDGLLIEKRYFNKNHEIIIRENQQGIWLKTSSGMKFFYGKFEFYEYFFEQLNLDILHVFESHFAFKLPGKIAIHNRDELESPVEKEENDNVLWLCALQHFNFNTSEWIEKARSNPDKNYYLACLYSIPEKLIPLLNEPNVQAKELIGVEHLKYWRSICGRELAIDSASKATLEPEYWY